MSQVYENITNQNETESDSVQVGNIIKQKQNFSKFLHAKLKEHESN